jgi:hypothetical protein
MLSTASMRLLLLLYFRFDGEWDGIGLDWDLDSTSTLSSLIRGIVRLVYWWHVNVAVLKLFKSSCYSTLMWR